MEARSQVLAAQKQIQNTAHGEALGSKGCRRGVRKGSSADQAEGGSSCRQRWEGQVGGFQGMALQAEEMR